MATVAPPKPSAPRPDYGRRPLVRPSLVPWRTLTIFAPGVLGLALLLAAGPRHLAPEAPVLAAAWTPVDRVEAPAPAPPTEEQLRQRLHDLALRVAVLEAEVYSLKRFPSPGHAASTSHGLGIGAVVERLGLVAGSR